MLELIQKSVKLLVCLVVFGTCVAFAYGQESADIKGRVLASIERIENYPAVVLKGEFENPASVAQVSFHVRGDKVWQEYDKVSKEISVKEQEAWKSMARKVMQCDLPRISAFDGKISYSFSPFTLLLIERPYHQFQSGVSGGSAMLPQAWVGMGNSSPFRSLAEGQGNADVDVEQMPDGKWKLSQENIGSQFPKHVQEKMAIRNRYVLVDPEKDYLVCEYKAWGGKQGELTGKLDWKEALDGHWYLASVVHHMNGKLICKWKIDSISFDAKKCRPKFDNLEALAPFSTRVQIYDSNRKLAVERYKGGKDGKEEHKLRSVALRSSKSGG